MWPFAEFTPKMGISGLEIELEQQYRSFRIETNEVLFGAGKRGQLGFALSLANLGKILQRLPEVRSLLMVVADCIKAQCFIFV